ncbi:Branched-chain alpha-keto acid dehydrogenase, E1 component, alpha subunit / Branched-chain alpha-keto acid dehydrogenase, E1 component, beta subunit [hydrothermal vent metagenome]|uniref:3-methyl-2-oxobutanoate dehydrogenase (2-methylpropanoyl-transferring) n=1 Tax=hydrothermal vent metagenome TaxID=652676 RepID=A0A3B0UML3_9ZZZZ
MSKLHPAFDWHEVAQLALASRILDEMEENELSPQGLVTYQFSARGHELGQLLLSQLLDRPFDAASAYYRSRPFLLGCGLTLTEALASDMARTGSLSGGRDVGVVFSLPRRKRAMVLPMAGDVGSQYTPGVGWAQAIRYHQEVLKTADVDDSIAVVFGGDGSVATNGFWSALTIATTLQLPLLFVIEDNGYAISVKGPAQTPGSNIAANLASFKNLTIWDGSGTHPAETAVLVHTAVQELRAGNGSGLLRLTVPRLSGHSSVDNQAYKGEKEVADEWKQDPIVHLHDYLVPALMTDKAWEEMVQQVRRDVAQARDEAMKQPHGDPATVTQNVLSDPNHPQRVGGLVGAGIELVGGTAVPNPPDPRRINMIEAIRRTLDVEMDVNPRLLVFGEDVGFKGGVHAATLGLQKKYGDGRVFDTSLNEEGIIGRSVGMAYAGLVPVPEIQFRKYADPATEQLNNCGTVRWRTNGRFAAPIVVRIPGGYRKIGDPWHSVTSEVIFAHQPGWLFAAPSNAEDTVGLLRTAMRGNDPVIFFEHRAMLDAAWARRPYPGDDYMLPFGQAKQITTGDDLTIVTWGAMVERCEEAVQAVNSSIEIIDLRTLVPWDKAMVLASVQKTSRCLIVHEDIGLGGFGAEIAATLVAEAFLDLDAPVERITAPSAPVPFSTSLMEGIVPTAARIQQKIEGLLAF